MEKLKFDGVSKTFVGRKKREFQAIKDVSFAVKENTFACLVGPSGCGKSTLLRIAAGLIEPSSGKVELVSNDKDAVLLSMVFQENAIFPWFTVYDNLALGLKARHMKDSEIKVQVQEQLQKLGLEKFASSYPSALSGGMKQRVNIGRAFIMNPEILLMDEPFASLDEQNRFVLQTELRQLWEASPKTVLFITHSIEEAIFLADEVFVMGVNPGRILQSFPIPFERNRKLEDIRERKEFAELHKDIWMLIKEEVMKNRE